MEAVLKAITKLEVKQEYTNKTLNHLSKELELVNKALINLTNVNDRVDNLSKRVDTEAETFDKRITKLETSDEENKMWRVRAVAIISTLGAIGSFLLNKIF